MLPELNTINAKDEIISRFLGLNQKDSSNTESFKDMQNMTSDEYPYLSPRKSSATRDVYSGSYMSILGSIVYGEDIYTVQGYTSSGTAHTRLFKNFEEVLINNNPVDLDANMGSRQVKMYGAYIVIFPDNIMYNTQENTVTNMSLEKTYTSQAYVYMSDKDGVPFVGDEFTTLRAGETSTQYWNGFTENIFVFGPTNQADANSVKMADWKAELIINNYTASRLPSYIDSKTIYYYDNVNNVIPNMNIIISNKDNLSLISECVNLNLYTIHKNKNGKQGLYTYNRAMSAFMPADIYLTIWIKTNDAELLEKTIKPGDYIQVDSLKANGELIDESYTKKSWYELVKKLHDKIKVEKVLRKNTDIGFVFKADSVDYLKMLEDGVNKIIYKQIIDYKTRNDDFPTYQNGIWKFDGLMFLTGNGDNVLSNKITVKKTVPDMDYITVSENRIWGCSSQNHEIYACKQGDATAWYNYPGLASDSYAVTIPNGDPFTGAVTYNDMPFFFTENMCYSIMGNKPKNYQIQKYPLRGVENGAWRTIAQKDGYVYYKSKLGIERFNGNNSQSLTEYLDMEGLNGWYGVTNNDKYFVYLSDTNGQHNLYVYDIKKRLWHKERQGMCMPFIKLDNNLYEVRGFSGEHTKLIRINGHATEVAPILTISNIAVTYDTPKWFVESGEFNGDLILNKYVTKFMFELKIEEGARLAISFMYDDSGEWEEVFNTTDDHAKRLIKVPILTRRCERMRYKIEGKGQAKIYSIVITYEGGTENG